MKLLNLDKRDLMGREFIFINDPDNINIYEQLNPTFNIDLKSENAVDLVRYVTKQFYDQDVKVDYSKQIKLALEFYLKKHITDKDLKEIEKMKAEEAGIIEEANKEKKPTFDWDLKNRKEKK